MSVLYFLLLVGALVSIHELGHFVAAKALDVKVLRFSLGFGPAIVKLRGRETEYQIGVVPLGGYVRLYGEDPAEPVDEADRHRSFSEKAIWRRLVVVFAGPAANLLVPLVIYFFFFYGHTMLPAAVIGDTFPGGPAAEAGLEPGDRVLAIDGQRVTYWEDLERIVDRIDLRGGPHDARFKVRRAGRELDVYVTPRRVVMRDRSGLREEQGLIGVSQAPFRPQIGVLDEHSAAGRAGLRTGDLIISVDGEPVDSWGELDAALRRHAKRAPVAYLRPRKVSLGHVVVSIHEPFIADLAPELRLGPDGRRVVDTGLVSAEFFVAAVEPGSPAALAGLQVGDLIRTLDGRPVTHWLQFDQALQAEPDREWRIGWLRGLSEHTATVKQERRRVVDEYGHQQERLVFGAANDFRPGHGEMVPIHGRFLYAAGHATSRTGATIAEMVRGFRLLISGDLPRDTVGGPIMMFRMASVSGAKGWDYFVLMIALISINLGLINLLPIPVLDGGHVLVFAVEAVRRRRLSARVREAIVLSGLALIVGLTVLALRNDIVRYVLR